MALSCHERNANARNRFRMNNVSCMPVDGLTATNLFGIGGFEGLVFHHEQVAIVFIPQVGIAGHVEFERVHAAGRDCRSREHSVCGRRLE